MISNSKDVNIIKLLEIEKSSLSSTLDIQKNLNKQILSFLKNFLGNIKIDVNLDIENNGLKYINEASNILNTSNINISKLNMLMKKLDGILRKAQNNSIEDEISDYNDAFSTEIKIIYDNTFSIEEFIHKISMLDICTLIKDTNVNQVQEVDVSTNNSLEISSELLNSSFVENTLVISEMRGKVILPYRIKEINQILLENNDKYSSIVDVINKLYTRPIEDYKYPSISRFKEAYKLVTQREHKSKLKALSLAYELFANLNLHPAIITACKSLDELDIYLACLDENTLNEFPFFEIKYDISTKIQKQDSAF